MTQSGDSHHILVADDDPTICALLKEILVQGGHSVVLCGNGKEALQATRSDVFSLLILDVYMPHRSGLDVIRELRERGDEVPVILMSGGMDEASLNNYADLERVACLYKPFLLTHIQSAIDAAMQADVAHVETWRESNAGKGSLDDDPPANLPLRRHAPPLPADRRVHHRFGLDDATASLRGVGLLSLFGKSKQSTCAAVDLSEGGLRLLAPERVPSGDRLKVKLRLERYQDEFEAASEVRWCRRLGQDGSEFDVGLKFVEPDAPRDRKIALMREWFTSPQFLARRENRDSKDQ